MEDMLVNQEELSVDELIADINNILQEDPPADPPEVFPAEPEERPASDAAAAEGIQDERDEAVSEEEEPAASDPQKPSLARRILKVTGKVLLVLLETVLLLVIALYGVMYVLAKGPSPTARDLFVRSVQETSAMGFLANLYFSEDQINEIISSGTGVLDDVETDTSLIEIPKPTEGSPNDGPTPDAWGLVDEDGDGIIVEQINGSGYSGYMMVVLDPSRVIVGSVPEDYGTRGYTVAEMVAKFGAVAGVNAGGFYDPNGNGNGSIPDAMVVYEGKTYYASSGIRNGFAGLDSNHILHVGKFSAKDVQNKDIQYGVSFGPVLVVNGEMVEGLGSGVNPRTAIGQRSDGAILLLVVDGRQVTSLGATYTDLAEIFLSYGAVNACNLDGGSSTMMWYQGGYINDCSSVVGIRPVPTTILVMPEGWEAGNE